MQIGCWNHSYNRPDRPDWAKNLTIWPLDRPWAESCDWSAIDLIKVQVNK